MNPHVLSSYYIALALPCAAQISCDTGQQPLESGAPAAVAGQAALRNLSQPFLSGEERLHRSDVVYRADISDELQQIGHRKGPRHFRRQIRFPVVAGTLEI